MQTPPTTPELPTSPSSPTVHTMPERFRAGSGGSKGPKGGASTTKKLLITFIIVLVVAGLGVAGLYVFSNVVKSNTNNENTNTALNLNTANLNTANVNTNTSTNLNENLNGNANDNSNLNSNVSSNLNTNTASNTNATNTNTTTTITKLSSSTDSDSDGLTDVEETLYTTDTTNTDTDGDTFIDGYKVQTDGSILGELANLYNPKGAGSLEGSTLVKRVQNSGNTFSLLVPKNWTTNESSSILVVTPTTQTGEFFQVRTYTLTAGQTLTEWYVANNPQAQTALLTSGAMNGLETLTTEDSSTTYFLKGTTVYGLNYVTGSLTQANYWTTMYMMMKSFKLVAS